MLKFPLITEFNIKVLLPLLSQGLFSYHSGSRSWPHGLSPHSSSSSSRKEHLLNKTPGLADKTSSWRKDSGCCRGGDVVRKEREGGRQDEQSGSEPFPKHFFSAHFSFPNKLQLIPYPTCLEAAGAGDIITAVLFSHAHDHACKHTLIPSQLWISLSHSCLNKPEDGSQPYFRDVLAHRTVIVYRRPTHSFMNDTPFIFSSQAHCNSVKSSSCYSSFCVLVGCLLLISASQRLIMKRWWKRQVC